MIRSTLKAGLLGLASVLTATSLLFADSVLDKHDDGTNQNDFLYYWYYYDDNAGMGADDRPQMAPTSTPTIIGPDIEFVEGPRHGFGNESDDYVVKTYTFKTGEEAGNKYATCPFVFGEEWETSYGTGKPYAGLGTMLTKEGEGLDMTGATAVKFKIRSHKGPLAIDFKIQTLDIDLDSSFGYYQTSIAVTTTWKEETVLIDDLAQPGWAKTKAPFKFDITKCTKIAWECQQEDNTTTTEDGIDVDDVEIIGYTWVSPFLAKNVKAAASSTLPTTKEFATFEKTPFHESPLGSYWYAYNDAAIGGTAQVLSGAVADPLTSQLSLQFAENSGNPGNGAGLTYVLGPSVIKPGTTTSVQSFVGIGVNLYDSAHQLYWDGSKATGVYFHYMTDGDAKTAAVLELSDIHDVADAATPTKTESERGPGVIWFIDLPATGGEWWAAEVKYTDLKIHEEWEGADPIPLDKTKLAKLQFKVQGGEGVGGTIAVDNIYFPGATVYSWDPNSVKLAALSSKASALKASYANGAVNVNWNGAKLTSGKISIVNGMGSVVATSSISKAGKLSQKFSAQKLSAGMYFVRLNATDAKGKTVAIQTPVHIVK